MSAVSEEKAYQKKQSAVSLTRKSVIHKASDFWPSF